MKVFVTGATGFVGSAIVQEPCALFRGRTDSVGITLLGHVMGGHIRSQKGLNAPLFVEEGADTETDAGAYPYQGTMELFHGVAHHHAVERRARISRG